MSGSERDEWFNLALANLLIQVVKGRDWSVVPGFSVSLGRGPSVIFKSWGGFGWSSWCRTRFLFLTNAECEAIRAGKVLEGLMDRAVELIDGHDRYRFDQLWMWLREEGQRLKQAQINSPVQPEA